MARPTAPKQKSKEASQSNRTKKGGCAGDEMIKEGYNAAASGRHRRRGGGARNWNKKEV